MRYQLAIDECAQELNHIQYESLKAPSSSVVVVAGPQQMSE